MSTAMTHSKETSLLTSVDKVFLRFLVGKWQLSEDDRAHDHVLDAGGKNANSDVDTNEDIERNGRQERTLLEVEKKGAKRKELEQLHDEQRQALLIRYFQQLLLKVVNKKLEDPEKLIIDHLQLHKSNVELINILLKYEPRYSVLSHLLGFNVHIRERLLELVGSDLFMAELGRSPRKVRDVRAAMGLIGLDVLRYLIPSLFFKSCISPYRGENDIFSKKLWRYELTLGQTCTALMLAENYSRPHEGMLLSAMLNFAYVASYQQYLVSFEGVRLACLEQARQKDNKYQHDFFYQMLHDPASLQALLLSQSTLDLSYQLAEKVFGSSFPHLVNAVKEEIDDLEFSRRSKIGKILFKSIRFSKYDQLRSARLFKASWLSDYLKKSEINSKTYRYLVRKELFRFKATW